MEERTEKEQYTADLPQLCLTVFGVSKSPAPPVVDTLFCKQPAYPKDRPV
jgi:hypothetical protein